ncbi:MAG: enoyl-CoA hydratase/isomerase family protein [Candidatus Zixiibacteriota bacterium]|nr:MAG: enoyl-CoA hydratase/isomerase family protein [candidate division Zixibacteria bacterium]
MADKILIESLHGGQVVRLTLNAPKANVLDAEMMADLQKALDDLPKQPDVKLVQFTGAGDHFCFGASVAEHVREKAPAMLAQFHRLFYTLADLAIPTAALISGQCLGGGLELALMCNFMFADKSAKLGQPEIQLGVFAPPASLLLPMKAGQAKADELLLTGKVISAEAAAAIGLVAEVFDDREAMLAGVDAWVAKHIVPKSAVSLRHAVRAARMEFNNVVKSKLAEQEKLYLDELMATEDANEGIQSFLDKRKPEWKNK